MPTFEELLAAARAKTAPPAPAANVNAAAMTRYGQCSRCGGPNDNPEAANAISGTVFCQGCTAVLNQAPPVMRAVRAPERTSAPAPAPAAPVTAPVAPASTINVRDLNVTAMLADVNVKMWTGQTHDKRVSREVASRHGSDVDMGRFTKRLVASERLKAIKKAAQDIGDYHRARTLPWGEGALRALSTEGTNIFDYESGLRERIENFDRLADDFCREWDTIREESRRQLGGLVADGGLFDPNDYPTATALRERFKVSKSIQRMPSTDTSDFRRTMGKAAADALQREIEDGAREAVRMAQAELVDRIRDTVGHMRDRLKVDRMVTDKSGRTTADSPIFRNTLTANVRDLADLVGSLNITQDPRLTDLAAEMRALATSDPEAQAEALRTNPDLRRQAAAAADDIVAKAEEFFA